MKYTIETHICYELEDDGIYTDEELIEITEPLLNDAISGSMKITDENGKVIEVKK